MKHILAVAMILALLPTIMSNNFPISPVSGESPTVASQIVAMVNGTNAYNYDLELERIACNHTLSNYSFRAGGSSGATATADWLVNQFESMGLEAYKEEFEFSTWEVASKPELVIDDDGNPNTVGDQFSINSFICEHYSWPTSQEGVFADLVVLPLPPAADIDEICLYPINTTAWNAIDTTGKIVLIGREVRSAMGGWEDVYWSKLVSQPPAAVIYCVWYDWMISSGMMSSIGGRPYSSFGAYYWNLQVPVGGLGYSEGLWIRNREKNMDVSAFVKIDAVIGRGTHYNVVGN